MESNLDAPYTLQIRLVLIPLIVEALSNTNRVLEIVEITKTERKIKLEEQTREH